MQLLQSDCFTFNASRNRFNSNLSAFNAKYSLGLEVNSLADEKKKLASRLSEVTVRLNGNGARVLGVVAVRVDSLIGQQLLAALLYNVRSGQLPGVINLNPLADSFNLPQLQLAIQKAISMRNKQQVQDIAPIPNQPQPDTKPLEIYESKLVEANVPFSKASSNIHPFLFNPLSLNNSQFNLWLAKCNNDATIAKRMLSREWTINLFRQRNLAANGSINFEKGDFDSILPTLLRLEREEKVHGLVDLSWEGILSEEEVGWLNKAREVQLEGKGLDCLEEEEREKKEDELDREEMELVEEEGCMEMLGEIGQPNDSKFNFLIWEW